jgi:hypothetical protein
VQYDPAKAQVVGHVQFAENASAAWATLHIRLPGREHVAAVDVNSGAKLLPHGDGLRWESPRGTLSFAAKVEN